MRMSSHDSPCRFDDRASRTRCRLRVELCVCALWVLMGWFGLGFVVCVVRVILLGKIGQVLPGGGCAHARRAVRCPAVAQAAAHHWSRQVRAHGVG